MLADILQTPAEGLADLVIKVWGPAGIIVVGLGVAVVILYNSKEKLQERRFAEAKDNAEKNAALAKELGDTMHDLTTAVDSLREVLLMHKGR